MDKYEFKLKVDEMKALVNARNYNAAAEIAETINWRKIRNLNALVLAGEVFEQVGRYDESREILLLAYDKSPIGRNIIYRLAEIAIKTRNFEDAEEYYDEFVDIAPHDNLKYVLKYKITAARGLSYKDQISILEVLKEQEYSEEWAYELAYLYHRDGQPEKCVDACDELILWFGDGIYVEKALELKMRYHPLTKTQEEKYRLFRQKRAGVIEVKPNDFYEAEKHGETVQEPSAETDIERKIAENVQQVSEALENQDISDVEPVEEAAPPEPESHMSFEKIMAEWEATKQAANQVFRKAKERRHEPLKEQSFQEAENLMKKLMDIIPQLTEAVLPENLLESEQEIGVLQQQAKIQNDIEEAERIVAGMNRLMQEQIDRLAAETGITVREVENEPQEYANAVEMAENAPPQEFGNEAGMVHVSVEMPADDTLSEMAAGDYYEEQPVEAAEQEYQEYMTDTEPELQQEDAYENAEQYEEPYENMEQYEESYSNGMQQEEPYENVIQETAEGYEEVYDDAVQQEEESFSKQEEDAGNERAPLSVKPRFRTHAQLQAETEDISEEDMAAAAEAAGFSENRQLTPEQKEDFAYFIPIAGMEEQICHLLAGVSKHLHFEKNSIAGNFIVEGIKGSGKTLLITNIIKVLQKECGCPNNKIGRIDANILNQKDMDVLLEKVSGGCLIIESAGKISRETAVKLSQSMTESRAGTLYVLEDTKQGIQKALDRDSSFAAKFTEKISIPLFTDEELISFGRVYANDLNYDIDEMGKLALHRRISLLKKMDHIVTVAEVKEVIEEAIDNAERSTLKRVFGILTSTRYNEDNYIILREKDFE